jgi:hypothetical protein
MRWDGTIDLSGQTINENFIIENNVKSLKGCPKIVKGSFTCIDNDNIETLEGAPEIIEGTIEISHCKNLKHLGQLPKIINENFICEYNENLVSLKGSPKIVKGHFKCINCDNIKTLEGAPEEVGTFYIASNKNLVSLKGIPKKINSVDNDYFNLEPGYSGAICCCENLNVIDDYPDKIEGLIKFEHMKIKKLAIFYKLLNNDDLYWSIIINEECITTELEKQLIFFEKNKHLFNKNKFGLSNEKNIDKVMKIFFI